jgi:hypothetical protein
MGGCFLDDAHDVSSWIRARFRTWTKVLRIAGFIKFNVEEKPSYLVGYFLAGH